MRFLLGIGLLVLFGRPALAAEKYALAVYHFNVQYAQGGLIGFPDEETLADQTDVTDEQLQDLVVTNSLEPLLDLYARHPDWGCDIEMQGLMMDVIVERHPGVLAKMKALANAGKVSFDSFHWSDQFWIAYPRIDMERSHDLVVKSFQRAGIPLGKSIFTQEGQFGMGMERFFRERGIRTAMVSGGVAGSTRDFPSQAINTLGTASDVYAVMAPCGSSVPSLDPGSSTACIGQHDDLVEVIWDWRDDGELAVTGGANPYLGKGMVYKEELTQRFEQQMVDEETAGYKHVSVDAYVDAVLALGEQPQPLPQLVDGVWHHDAFLWMGGTSLWDGLAPNIRTSADNTVLTSAMQARKKILQVESAVAQLKTTAFDARLEQAWKHLLMAECSDGSGQNPWAGERKYSLEHSAAALKAAEDMLKDRAIATHLAPQTKTYPLVDDAGPFQLQVLPDAHRPPQIKWQKRKDEEIWELSVTFPAVENDLADGQRHQVRIDFPRTGDDLIYSQALEDEKIVTMPLSGINGEETTLPDGSAGRAVIVAAANGLVGLGGGYYLIKRTESVHVAAHFLKGAPFVMFKDDTADTDAVTWKFVVVKPGSTGAQGESEVLAEVAGANIGAEPLVKAPGGCGCDLTSGDAGVGLFALLGLIARRRSRR